jgi:hypothetical protein
VVLSLVVLSFSFFRLCNILPKSTFSFSFFNSSSICTNMLKIIHRFLINCGSARWRFCLLSRGFLPVSALARNFVLVIFPLRPTWLFLESFSVRRRPRIVRCLPGVLDRNYCNGSFFGRPHFPFSGCIRSLGGFWRISGIGWLRSSLKLGGPRFDSNHIVRSLFC